jgi:hypothetical protein
VRPGRSLITAVALLAAGCTTEVTGSPRGVSEPDDDGGFGRKVFDEAALEGDQGVRKILVEDYNEPAEDVGQVDCPAEQEVVPGDTFECTVVIRGEEMAVAITVIDDEGQYEVGLPESR